MRLVQQLEKRRRRNHLGQAMMSWWARCFTARKKPKAKPLMA